ncbi:kinase-like protein [Calocera cornea HHB12733]|uniref:Kinase-like protein n=1 Tax=Calocera cornea HHB12733 TaxID=1353952 RepID=A0A165G2Z0_9BASI|nr:kinase-like protein [Calocera cornea HHB12733]
MSSSRLLCWLTGRVRSDEEGLQTAERDLQCEVEHASASIAARGEGKESISDEAYADILTRMQDARKSLAALKSWRRPFFRIQATSKSLRRHRQSLVDAIAGLQGAGGQGLGTPDNTKIPNGRRDPLAADITDLVATTSTDIIQSPSNDMWLGEYRSKEHPSHPVKVILKESRVYAVLRYRHLHQAMDREIIRWPRLRHPNVLPFFGTTDLAKRRGYHYYFVSPWMDNGDIMHYLAAHTSADRKHLIMGIVYGLQYLHSQAPPIVHGSLKASNVLVTDAGDSVLCDYGQARFADDMPTDITIDLAPECARWAAPEHFPLAAPESGKVVDLWVPSSDIFSLGMTIYEILSGSKPFADKSNRLAREAIQDGNRPDIQDAWKSNPHLEIIIDLMTRCWDHDPGKRPTSAQATALLQEDHSTPPQPSLVAETSRNSIEHESPPILLAEHEPSTEGSRQTDKHMDGKEDVSRWQTSLTQIM